jgi:hypothetical protein
MNPTESSVASQIVHNDIKHRCEACFIPAHIPAEQISAKAQKALQVFFSILGSFPFSADVLI